MDFDNLTVSNIPHSILLLGDRGGRQNEFCENLAGKFGMSCIDITNEITKDFIDTIYLSPNPAFYKINIAEIDEKRQNMMLKLFEEPGAFTFIILIAESTSDVIDTIYNRSYEIRLPGYTYDELLPYVAKDEDIVMQLCSTPGQIEIANHTDIKALCKLCDTILNSMKTAAYYNALTIANKINYKDEYDKFDLYLFIKAFERALLLKMHTDGSEIYYKYNKLLNEFRDRVRRVNNKKQQMENFITQLWEVSRCQ